MGMRIRSNTAALATARRLEDLSNDNRIHTTQLSSGERIVESGIDPAGLAISEKMKAHIRSRHQSIRNANDSMSLFQVADGALNEVSSMGIRLKELAVRAASDTWDHKQRANINIEFDQVKKEIERIANSTKFNGTPILNGRSGALDFQVGIHNKSNDRISFKSDELDSRLSALGIEHANLLSKLNSQKSLDRIDNMIQKVARRRSEIGAKVFRLNSTSNSSTINNENSAAAKSRIADADIAKAHALHAKDKIMMDATVAMHGIASHRFDGVSKLL